MAVTRSNVITVKADPEEGERFPHPFRDFITQFLEKRGEKK